MDAEDVLRAVARHVGWQQGVLVPQAVVRYAKKVVDDRGERLERRHYVADLMWLNQARATEIEIKVSRGDWRADLAKAKWGALPRWVARFAYAAPEELGVPDWVPPSAAVWQVRPDGRVCVARAGRLLNGAMDVPERALRGWREQMYLRYWMQRAHRPTARG